MNKFSLNKSLQILQQQKSTLPQALAEATQAYFNKSFDTQSFNAQPWKDVQRHFKKGGNNKPILQQTGTLKNAVSKSLVKADFASIKFEVQGIKYAAVHNQGLKAGRGKGFQMPQRQFIGHTEELAKIQKEIIRTYISLVFTK